MLVANFHRYCEWAEYAWCLLYLWKPLDCLLINLVVYVYIESFICMTPVAHQVRSKQRHDLNRKYYRTITVKIQI